MTANDPSCRFLHSFSPDGLEGQCLHHQVFLRDRHVTAEVCGACEKRIAFGPDREKPIDWPLLDKSDEKPASSQRNCLIVLQPRDITKCLTSIAALPVDKVYFRAFSEHQLVVPLNRFIQETEYDNYLLVSDDVIVSERAYRLVAELLERHELATGYCRLSQDSLFVNLTRGPLRLRDGRAAQMADYDFYHIDEIRQFQSPVFLSWFGGWALTGMRRALWLEFPFRVNRYSAIQSDFEASYNLHRPFVTHSDAYIEHLKPHVMGFLAEGFLVGQVAPEIIYEKFPV